MEREPAACSCGAAVAHCQCEKLPAFRLPSAMLLPFVPECLAFFGRSSSLAGVGQRGMAELLWKVGRYCWDACPVGYGFTARRVLLKHLAGNHYLLRTTFDGSFFVVSIVLQPVQNRVGVVPPKTSCAGRRKALAQRNKWPAVTPYPCWPESGRCLSECPWPFSADLLTDRRVTEADACARTGETGPPGTRA